VCLCIQGVASSSSFSGSFTCSVSSFLCVCVYRVWLVAVVSQVVSHVVSVVFCVSVYTGCG